MAELQGRGEALKYRQQGVAAMDRVLRTRATVKARAAAGGIDPFAGSALALQDFALAEGSQEIYVSRDNEIIAREGGTLQSSLYRQQAKQAYRGGLFGALTTVANTGISLYKIGSAPTSGASSASAPVRPSEASILRTRMRYPAGKITFPFW